MSSRRWIEMSRSACLAATTALLLSAPVLAQDTGLVGVVKDATGGVLPGVTVESASPALIEKVRSVTTDEQGQYRIIDLRPGAYVVTFSLTGFTTVKREGIDLQAGFTATVNGELRVGGVEETIIVSGQSSTVDVISVRRQTVLSNDTLASLPSQRSPQSFVPYLPGVVGGLGDVGRDTAALGRTHPARQTLVLQLVSLLGHGHVSGRPLSEPDPPRVFHRRQQQPPVDVPGDAGQQDQRILG